MFPVSNTFYVILGKKNPNKKQIKQHPECQNTCKSAVYKAGQCCFAEREEDYLVQATPALVISTFLEEHEELEEKEFFLITFKLH